ncbi:MAG: hypothetical protein CME19_19355 [Gemmatimonadetes bacterium]|nr:hypothetical protein [Gemmatimonadota bacterium]
MTDRPGICMVGCGQIAVSHAKRLKGNARLSFHSRSRESADRLCSASGGGVVYERFEDALDTDEVQAVMITTPPEFHARQVIQALSAGKTVFVEKPMCLNREEIAAIEDAKGDRPVFVGENYYYKPSLELLRRWIEEGAIGTVRRAKVSKRFLQVADGWKAGHGALFEGGIHFVALLNGLFGPPTSVDQATFPGHEQDQPERHSIVETSLEDVTAVLEYSWNTPSVTKGTFQHSSIEGDKGRIVFESNGIYARLKGTRSSLRFPLVDLMGAGAMIDDFLELIRSRRPPVSDFERAKQDLETVFQAYERGGIGLPSGE